MMEYTAAEREHMAAVLAGVANPARIAILFGLRDGKLMPAIADEIGMTRGGVQKHIESLIDAELVYRPSSEESTYALTPLGRFLAELLEQNGDSIAAVLTQLDEQEESVREEIGQMQELVDEIDQRTWERTVHTRTWEQAMDTIETLLENQD